MRGAGEGGFAFVRREGLGVQPVIVQRCTATSGLLCFKSTYLLEAVLRVLQCTVECASVLGVSCSSDVRQTRRKNLTFLSPECIHGANEGCWEFIGRNIHSALIRVLGYN